MPKHCAAPGAALSRVLWFVPGARIPVRIHRCVLCARSLVHGFRSSFDSIFGGLNALTRRCSRLFRFFKTQLGAGERSHVDGVRFSRIG
jgi:hypothetical protein